MPIDPNIALSVRPMQLPNPLEIYDQSQRLRMQQQAADALAAERHSQAELQRAQSDKLAREAQKEAAGNAALDELFTSYQPGQPIPTGPVGKLYRAFGPERTASIVKGIADMANADITNADALRKSMTTRLLAIEALPEARRPAAWDAVGQDYVGRGVVKPEELPAYSPETLQFYKNALLTPDKRYDVEHPKPIEMQPGGVLVNPQTGATVASVPPKEQKPQSVLEYEYAKTQGYKGTYEQYQTEDANRKRPATNVSGMSGMYNQTDPKGIAEGIISGSLPPKIADYGRAVQGAVATELQKRGFNLAAAVTDWTATQKHIQTMNGAQQLRLNQSINALPDLLDSVDTLAGQWKANARLPILNRANLLAAKGGAYGKDAASVANQLETQIADAVGDLGTVYMGGNSPTDHALKLAETALKSDWDEKVLHDMVKLAKNNVTIRRNSILQTGVSGASASNPYAPAAAQTPAAAPAVEEWVRDPKTGRMVKKGGG